MRILGNLISGLKGLFRGRQLNQEMDEELQSYLDCATEEKISRGMSPSDAHREARVEMGSTDTVKQRVWAVGWESQLETVLQDLKYAVRVTRKSPGFTGVVVITLALGIGANTAIFSLINAIMLRTLSVNDPHRLVSLKWMARTQPDTAGAMAFVWGGCPDAEPTDHPVPEGCVFSYPMFDHIRSNQTVFTDVSALVPTSVTLNVAGHSSRAQSIFVSGNFFSTIGTRPAFGRLLTPADDNSASSAVAVVGFQFWREQLNGDLSAIGREILIGKTRFTLVGIAPSNFAGLDPGIQADFWLPLAFQPDIALPFIKPTESKSQWLAIIGRLKPGISVTQAEAAMTTIFVPTATEGVMALFKPADSPRIELPSLAYGFNSLRYNFSRPLLMLMAAVGLVLLIVCINIAGLMLARSSARQKELAIRTSLGATRTRIVRQLITEGLLLSILGGVVGTILAYWGATALTAFFSANWFLPITLNVHPEPHVLGFTLLISILVGLLFAAFPAMKSARIALVPALKANTNSGPRTYNSRWFTVGNSLVFVQVSLAVLVLVGAGLLVRTLVNLKNIQPGFDPNNIVLFDLDATYTSRSDEALARLAPEVRERLESLPGVRSVSYSLFAPMKGWGMHIALRSIGSRKLSGTIGVLPIGPNFFETMKIGLLAGRNISAVDMRGWKTKQSQVGAEKGKLTDGDTYPVAVVNNEFAQKFFSTESPVGQSFFIGPSKRKTEVVGVVGDARQQNLREVAQPMVYVPISPMPEFQSLGTFEIRTATDPKALIPTVSATLKIFDSNLLVSNMKTQREQIDQNIYEERLIANLSSLFALLALSIACVGIYGLLSYQVSRRTNEIGIRMALGARRWNVLALVLRQGIVIASLGALVGTLSSLALTRYLKSVLFEVTPYDPVTIVAVAGGLVITALLASYIPARRASRVDPTVALRYE